MTRTARRWTVVGIDLAWGERRSDGLCLLQGRGKRVAKIATDLVRGDAGLLAWLRDNVPPGEKTLLCLDAPVVCPNLRGARPVDRLTHRLFHREQAGAHPANRARCVRPLRVVAALQLAGFSVATDWPATTRAIVEVYPHPATVRWFGLRQTIKYKRGPISARRREFARLQGYLRKWLDTRASEIAAHAEIASLLRLPWTKDGEDRTDALLCALVGWQWAVHGEGAVEILGDESSGFLVLPEKSSLIGLATEFPPDSPQYGPIRLRGRGPDFIHPRFADKHEKAACVPSQCARSFL